MAKKSTGPAQTVLTKKHCNLYQLSLPTLKHQGKKINVDMPNTMKHFLNATSYKSCYMKHTVHKKKSLSFKKPDIQP